MLDSIQIERLKATVDLLRQYAVVPNVARALSDELDEVLQALLDTALREVPALTASANPDVIPELKDHLQQHLNAVRLILSGQPAFDFDFVRDHARRRAEQKFPLDGALAAYRCLHKGLANWLRDAALRVANSDVQVTRVVAAASDFTIEYTGAIGTLITSEYVLQTRVFAEAEGDRKTELLSTLLSGFDESDPRAAQLLRRAGYLEQRQSFCVAVAHSVDPTEMLNAARAQRMADAVSQALGNLPIRVLTGIRENRVTVVLAATRRQSGWTAPQSPLADRVYPHLRLVGTAALIGISSDVPSTSHVPAAFNEAKLALDYSHVANRVVSFARIPFRDMLVRTAAIRIRSAMPGWTGKFLAADRKAKGALALTLRTYADADMNALKTAKTLNLHPNTIYARMQKINDITGRSPLSYHGLTELLLATDCAMLTE
jgi:hypothetical protein